jgi:hypothetical protein
MIGITYGLEYPSRSLTTNSLEKLPPTTEECNKYKTGAISPNSTVDPMGPSNIERHAPVIERKRTNIDDEPVVLD